MFQRLMNDVLRDYLRKFCSVYLDDIIIYSKSLKDHKRHMKKVLQVIRSASLIDAGRNPLIIAETILKL